MIKKLMSIGMAAVMAAGVMVVSADDAEARRRRGVGVGIAAGVIGLGILGAAASANAGPRYYSGPRYYDGPRCYPGPRRCGYNRYGEYTCWRPRICD